MKKLPKNLKDTIQYIDNLKLKDIDYCLDSENEDDFISKTHFGLGLQLRNGLYLWHEQSELRDWFVQNYFLNHPDDISSLILIYYYRVKKAKDTNLLDIVNRFYNHWIEHDPNFYKKLKKFKLDKINEYIKSEKQQ